MSRVAGTAGLRLLATGVLAAALLAGCGTTVPLAARNQGADGSLDTQGGSPTGVAPERGASQPGTSTDPRLGGSEPLSGAGAKTLTPAVPTALSSGPAVPSALKTPVRLGIMMTDFNKAAAAFGFSGEAVDTFKGFKDMVRYLNQHGGLNGRTIQPDYYALDGAATSGSTAAGRRRRASPECPRASTTPRGGSRACSCRFRLCD